MIELDKDKFLNILREVIYRLTGNYYPDERLKMLEYKLDNLISDIKDYGAGVEDVLYKIQKDEDLKKKLINLVTVPETRFFREYEQLEVIRKYIFVKLKEGKGIIKTASIGCSTGEEAYTIAFILKDIKADFKLVGMDINEIALEKAKEGKYPLKALSQIPENFHKYVIKSGDFIEIKKEIKESVTFKTVNLTEERHFENMKDEFDAVFCRNVLIYFDRNSKKKAIDNLCRIIKPYGYLILSATEMLTAEFKEGFETVRYEKFLFYRKVA